MDVWLEEMKAVQERMETKMDTNLNEMKTGQEHMKEKILRPVERP
jgi:hypothetical protein